VAGTLAGIKTAVADQTDQQVKGAIDKIGEKIDSMKETYTPPAQPEYSDEFGENQEVWSELLDPKLAAETKANLDKAALLEPAQGPAAPSIITTTVDASACMEGDIHVGHTVKHVQICFNKPWMMTGYAIMKPIMIVIGYLQVAMMLNRAVFKF